MIDLLKKLIQPPAAREDVAPGVALAALMVEAARGDDDYSDVERARIDEVLSALLDLPAERASALRAEGEAAQAEAVDLVRFTRVLKSAFPYEERGVLIEALWRVALADGVRVAEEDALIRRLAPLLGVSDPDSAAARRRAGG